MPLTREALIAMSGDDLQRTLLHAFFPPGSRLPRAPGLEQIDEGHPRHLQVLDVLLNTHTARGIERTDTVYLYSRVVDGIVLDAGIVHRESDGCRVAFRASDDRGEITLVSSYTFIPMDVA